MLKNNNIMNNINAVGSATNSMMQSCANSVLSSCPVSSSMTPGSVPMKTPAIDSPCMMPGSPSANPMISSGIGHHSPSIPTSNPAMMPGGAPDIASSPIMNPGSSVPQPTLTGDSCNRIEYSFCNYVTIMILNTMLPEVKCH